MMLSLSLIPALAQYLVLPFCPESPRYLLINRGEESKAEAGRYNWLWCFNWKFSHYWSQYFHLQGQPSYSSTDYILDSQLTCSNLLNAWTTLQQILYARFCNPAALLRLRGSSDKVFAELEEMKEEAAHTQTGVTIHEFFKKRSYRQPIIIVLFVNLGSQLSGFNAVSRMKCICL